MKYHRKYKISNMKCLQSCGVNANEQIQYNRARHYDPEYSRWLQRDPWGYVDGMGLYEYVKSRPWGLTDAMGEQSGSAGQGPAVGSGHLAKLMKKLKEAMDRLKKANCNDFLKALQSANDIVNEIENLIEAVSGAPKYEFKVAKVILEGLELANRVRCRKPCESGKKCLPCIPPVGTLMYEIHNVPPSKPHWPYEGTHIHYYVVLQSPPPVGCGCWAKKINLLDGAVIPGAQPLKEPGGGGVVP